MKTNRKDLIIGAVILVGLLIVIIWSRRNQELAISTPTPFPTISEEELEKDFNLDIPDNIDKANLSDVSGGTGLGLATRDFANSTFTVTVLGDLPEPQAGYFYQAWAVRGNEGQTNYAQVSLGKMRVAKGGWLLDFQSKVDYSDYSKVVVSLEKTFDQKMEMKVLEGSF